RDNLILFRISGVQILPTQPNRRSALGCVVPREGSCHHRVRVVVVVIVGRRLAAHGRRRSPDHHAAAALLLLLLYTSSCARRLLSLLQLRPDEVLQQVAGLGGHLLVLVGGGCRGRCCRRCSTAGGGGRVAANDGRAAGYTDATANGYSSHAAAVVSIAGGVKAARHDRTDAHAGPLGRRRNRGRVCYLLLLLLLDRLLLLLLLSLLLLLVLGGARRSTLAALHAGERIQVRPPEFEHIPVEYVVVDEALPVEERAKQLAQVAVVGSLDEVHVAAVGEVEAELTREALAQLLDRRGQLLLRNALVLLALVGRLQALPRQRAEVEVHQHVAERLEVVAARLLDAKMCVYGRVPSRAGQVLVFPVRDVRHAARILVLLCQPEVDDVHQVALLAQPHQEVVRLDVAVDEAARVYEIDTGNHLVGEQQHRLQREPARAEIEQILERGAEQLHHHHVVVTLRAAPPDRRDADRALQHLVELALDVQLGVLRFDALQLDRDLLAGGDVCAEIDVTERAGTDLPTESVLVADAQLHRVVFLFATLRLLPTAAAAAAVLLLFTHSPTALSSRSFPSTASASFLLLLLSSWLAILAHSPSVRPSFRTLRANTFLLGVKRWTVLLRLLFLMSDTSTPP
uniref:Uncharacterized protein n=1 Tax=Anopheles atroparvus TaxID=41427 RepID=A0AAG5D9D6_ANOAO